MQKQRTRHRRRQQALALLMAAAVLMPAGGVAQQNRNGGLFGRGGTRDNSEVGASGVLNQGFGSNGNTLYNQGFGSNSGGLTNQGFAVPIGSGLLVLAAAGVGYATLKKRNKKTNQQKQTLK